MYSYYSSPENNNPIKLSAIKTPAIISIFLLCFSSYITCGQHSLCAGLPTSIIDKNADSLISVHETAQFNTWQERVCINLLVSKYLRTKIGSCNRALAALNKNFKRHKVKNQNSEDGTLLASFYTNLGYCNLQEENFEEALKYYGLAKALFRDSIDFDQNYLVNYILTPIGNIHTIRGDYQRALLNLIQVNEILVSLGKYSQAASLLPNIGIAYSSMGAHQAALDTFLSAEQQIAGDNYALALANFNIAHEYLYLKKYQPGINSLNKALSIMDKSKEDDRAHEFPMLRAECHSLKARLLAEENKFIEAEESIQRTLGTIQSLDREDGDREVAKMHIEIGEIYLEQGKTNKVFKHIGNALRSLIPGTILNERDNPKLHDLFAENTFGEIMDLKARTYNYLYRRSNNTEYLEKSLDCYLIMFHVWDLLRKKYNYTSSHRHVLKINRLHLEQALHTVYLLREHNHKANYDDIIINLLTRAKNLLLQEAWQLKHVAYSMHSDSVKDALRTINLSISKLKQLQFDHINKSGRKQKLDSLEIALDVALESKIKLENIITSAYDSFEHQSSVHLQSLGQIQNEMANDQTVIDYFLGDSLLFIYSFDRNNSVFLKSGSSNTCRKSIDTLRSGLLDYWYMTGTRQNNKAYEIAYDYYLSSAHTLYNLLIKPIDQLKKKIVIFPDASLTLSECIL